MAYRNSMKRLFNLFLVYLKTVGQDRNTLKNEIEILHLEIKSDTKIPSNVKETFNQILLQYQIIYESDSLVERYEAEERIKELLEELK